MSQQAVSPSMFPEFETRTIHHAQSPAPGTNAIAVPIYQNTAFVFNNAQHIEDIMTNKTKAFVYSRMGNPTNAIFEERMAALEGGIAAVATATGAAATMLAIFAVAKSGDNFVVGTKMFGGTWQQFNNFFARLGITAHFTTSTDPSVFENLIDENTKGIFVESVSNPALEVLDLAALAEVAHRNGILFIVDNTVGAAGYLLRPIDHGADIVVHSATKWICGHGTTLGGVLISSGKENLLDNPKFKEFNEPFSGYPGVILAKTAGPLAMVTKMRGETLRDSGCTLAAFAAWQLLQGLETLHVRVDRQCENALKLAQYLQQHEGVAWVSYPGLETNPTHDLAKKYLQRGFGALVSFGLKPTATKAGDVLAAEVIDATKLCSHAANLGDVRTLIVHPGRTTQRQLPPQAQLDNGTSPDLVRVSLGLENIKDIIKDFEQAIATVLSV
ncbi:O-acetylhomoserine/O-acetylserine sulfhydrylase [Meredithblackwellia eburnea MCA 4105]